MSGDSLFVTSWGRGPEVVLLHGLGASSWYWESLAATSSGFLATAPDLLGFGRSPSPPDASYDVCHLAALAPHLPERAVVVAHSTGAILAAALAARWPERVASLLLLGLTAFPNEATARRLIGSLGLLARLTVDGRPSARRLCEDWVNGPMGQRLGLLEIPDGPVNPRALRRTLALSIAQRPHGLMAAKVHLKHVSVATTEGYAARPGGHQAAFLAEVATEEQAEHTRLTIAAYDEYRRGVLPSGKGARELLSCFEAVDHALGNHEAGAVTVIDDRRVERLLHAKAKTLHVGIANYCWFSDPRRALCLKLAGTPEASEPLIGMCDSARCPQATHHAQHRQPWADHAEATMVVLVDNPRLSRLERERARVASERAAAVVAAIDASGADGLRGQ